MKVFEKKLIIEINKMKETLLLQNLKIFDILYMDCDQLSSLNVEEVMRENIDNKLVREFPLSFNILSIQLKKAVRRKLKKQNAKISLRCLIQIDLPSVCYEEIFKYLSNDDLNNLKDSQVANVYETNFKKKLLPLKSYVPSSSSNYDDTINECIQGKHMMNQIKNVKKLNKLFSIYHGNFYLQFL